MDLVTKIVETYPNIEMKEFNFVQGGTIQICDDGDGVQYIAKWNYSEPIPEGLTLGKPA
jgi:hypothetical protein